MKKFLILSLVMMFSASFLKAQTDPELDYIKQAYSKSKKDLVADYMAFSVDDAGKFWPVYSEYDAGREKLAVERVNTLNEYLANWSKLTPELADKLGTSLLANTLALDKLNSDYFGKFKKAVGPLNAAKYLQLEIFLQTSWRSIIQQELPLVKALESTKN